MLMLVFDFSCVFGFIMKEFVRLGGVMGGVVVVVVVIVGVFCHGTKSEFPTAPTTCAKLKCIPPRNFGGCRIDE